MLFGTISENFQSVAFNISTAERKSTEILRQNNTYTHSSFSKLLGPATSNPKCHKLLSTSASPHNCENCRHMLAMFFLVSMNLLNGGTHCPQLDRYHQPFCRKGFWHHVDSMQLLVDTRETVNRDGRGVRA